MKNILFSLVFLVFGITTAQQTHSLAEKKIQQLLSETASTSAQFAIEITDAKGNVEYSQNPHLGLTPASTQKIFTAIYAVETLGTDYRFPTELYINGDIHEGTLTGDIILFSHGDPSLGSWRYSEKKPEDFLKWVHEVLSENYIHSITGKIITDDSFYDFQSIPGGWPYNDTGNYYGAGVWGTNWRENQYDIIFNNGKIIRTQPQMEGLQFINEISIGGTSDQSLVYSAPLSSLVFINGKLPKKEMTVSASMPNPGIQLAQELKDFLHKNSITVNGIPETYYQTITNQKLRGGEPRKKLGTYYSPQLSLLTEQFLKKSINLYGEAFLKAAAKFQSKNTRPAEAVQLMKEFWVRKGIDPMEINFADGSGLSPQNYVSVHAMNQALNYARNQAYSTTFTQALPSQSNGMKLKSGTIKNTKGYAGYSKDGKKTVAVLINNYQGEGIGPKLLDILASF